MIAGPTEGEARAEEIANQSLAVYERLSDLWGRAAALNVLGWLYVAQERFDGNEELFGSTLTTAIAGGDQQFISMAEVNLAEYHLYEGNIAAATELLTSCVSRHRSLRLMYSVAYLLDAVARISAREQGAIERGAARRRCVTLARRLRGVGVGQPTCTPRSFPRSTEN